MTPTQRSIDPTSRIEPVSPDQLTGVTGGGGLLGKLFGGKSGTLGFAGNLLGMFGGAGTGTATASAPRTATATNLMSMFKSFAGAAAKPSAKPSTSPEPSNRTASTETTGEGSRESA
jgi:hypothetical protein